MALASLLFIFLFRGRKRVCGHGYPYPSSRRKEGRRPWSLPFSSWEMEECGHGHPPHPLLGGRREGSHGLCFSPLEWGGVEWSGWMGGWGHGHLPTFLLEEEWR